jgi:hypothetical protein
MTCRRTNLPRTFAAKKISGKIPQLAKIRLIFANNIFIHYNYDHRFFGKFRPLRTA